MRIYGDPKLAKINLARGRERARQARVAFNGEPLRRPDRGTLLRTIQVTDHLTQQTYTIEIKQGARKNGIEAYRFGRCIECGGSYDGLFRMLRRRWALRWLTA